MLMQNDNFLQRPRETIQCLLIGICCVWQSLVALLGLVAFLVFIRGLRFSVWQMLIAGSLLAACSIFIIEWQAAFKLSLLEIIQFGFASHLTFWKIFYNQGLGTALKIVYQQAFYYLLGFPLFFAGLLAMTEWITNSTHEWELRAIQRGRALSQRKPWKMQLNRWRKIFSKQTK